jgi:hypothetical protein
MPVPATVEGTLIHGTSAAFAGGPPNVVLGRSVSSVRGSFPCRQPHRRQQVPSGCRGGERRQHAQSARTLPGKRSKGALHARGHVLRSVQRPVHVNRHSSVLAPVSGQRSVRYRGRANLRKQEEPAPRSERTDACAARRASPLLSRRSCVTRQKRKEVMASVPARKRELRLVSVRRVRCRSRQAGSWPQISSHAALQKEWR